MPRILALALLVPAAMSAEVLCSLGAAPASYNPSLDQRSSPDALQLAARVNTAVSSICADHCPTMSLLRNTSAADVMLIADSGQGKLVYSPQFFATAYESFGDAGILALLAHELGHALDVTLGAAWIKKSWSPELRADAWAGCVIAKMNLGAAGLPALEKYPSAAHPAWSVRLPVIRTGYTQCGGTAKL